MGKKENGTNANDESSDDDIAQYKAAAIVDEMIEMQTLPHLTTRIKIPTASIDSLPDPEIIYETNDMIEIVQIPESRAEEVNDSTFQELDLIYDEEMEKQKEEEDFYK